MRDQNRDKFLLLSLNQVAVNRAATHMLFSTGMMYCRLKQFLHHNYDKNCMASTSKASSSPLPWVLVMGDGCVMWRVRERGDQGR